MPKPIKVLGICGSPRASGNSRYLLDIAVEEAENAAAGRIEAETVGLSGLRIEPCTSCYTCGKRDGECFIEDDFAWLRDKWADADAIIYSIPVYHMGIPGQLKCFIDRLGSTLWSYYGGVVAKSLRVIGSITQGSHLFAGQEQAATALIQHTLVMGGIPVCGDPWESYIAASGWTRGGESKSALQRLSAEGDEDALITERAAASLGRRVAQMALLIQAGGEALHDELVEDGGYSIFLERLRGSSGAREEG
jgi:multimeric flavodoxin WrbA